MKFITSLKFIFLFHFLTNVSSFVQHKRVKRKDDGLAFCGGHNLLSMAPVQYRSNLTNELKTVLIADQPIGRGQIGEVFIGYYTADFVAQIDATNFMPTNCVAIKIVQNYATQMFKNGINVWEQLQHKVPKPKRQHIVELIDHGKIAWNKYLAIMEMGEAETFYDHLRLGFVDETATTPTTPNIAQLIRQMVEPLKEIHQVAIHLDYKPSNLVFVTNQITQQKKIKLVDFDSAVPIPSLNIGLGRANIFEQPPAHAMVTRTYVCPEFHTADLVSTKADVWAFGISLYELLLNHSKYKNATDDLDALLDSVADLHRGFCVPKFGHLLPLAPPNDGGSPAAANDDGGGGGAALALLGDGGEPRFVEALLNIVQIWTDWPNIALLISTLLDTDFVVRMTAIGVLDYLDEKCCPQSVKKDDHFHPNQLTLFNKITFQQIHSHIAKLLRQNQTADNERTGTTISMLKTVNKLIEQFVEEASIADWIEKVRARERICDTASTQF